MKIYLVDFENVKSKGLQGIDNLTETDTVIIFYSENSDTINFEMHQKVLTSKADIEYFKVNVGGKNALDFQLSTLLGYLVAKDTYTNIFVISNDRGFDFLHDFWHGKYVDSPNAMVYRTRTIQTAINFANHKVNPTENNEDEESTKHIVEKAEEIQETEEIQTESEITLDEADEPNPESAAIDYSVTLNENMNGNTEEVEEEPEACAPDIVEVESDPVVETIVKVKKGRKKCTTQKNNDLRSILANICSEEQIEEISKLIAESNTKEELHNSLAKVYKKQATDFYKLLRPRYLRLKGLQESDNTYTADEDKTMTAQKTEKVVYHDVLSVKLDELLDGKCNKDELALIREAVIDATTKQQLYIRMVKEFKKEKGCDIYNKIKPEYVSLHKLASEIIK